MTKTEEYIYLDWNVFKYIKKPREKNMFTDTEFKRIILRLGKKYAFPYSEGHLLDLMPGYEEHKVLIYNDLDFISEITRDVVLSSSVVVLNSTLKDEIKLSKQRPHEFYEKLRVTKSSVSADYGIQRHPSNTYEFYQTLYKDHKLYKEYRSYAPTILEAIQNNVSIDKIKMSDVLVLFPFLELCENESDLQILQNKYQYAVRSWLLYRYKDPSKIPFGEVISTGYSLLDFHPLFNEKLSKKNGLSNITRDSKHAFYGHKAKYYISEDDSTIEKLKFLYSALNLNTKVIKMEEMVATFS